MGYFDPVYLIFLAPGLLLSMWASSRVQSAFAKYSTIGTSNNMSGAEVAAQILEYCNIHDVEIVETHGMLSDHYNPLTKQVALSTDVYHGRSIASIGVAAHECGHAVQHANLYMPLKLRSMLFVPANLGSQFSPFLIMAGIAMSLKPLLLAGIALFTGALLFQVVTLPVEFDATARAKRLVVEMGLVHRLEREGMDRVLNAAALTYVGAAVTTLLTLIYYLFRAGLLGGSRDDDR